MSSLSLLIDDSQSSQTFSDKEKKIGRNEKRFLRKNDFSAESSALSKKEKRILQISAGGCIPFAEFEE